MDVFLHTHQTTNIVATLFKDYWSKKNITRKGGEVYVSTVVSDERIES